MTNPLRFTGILKDKNAVECLCGNLRKAHSGHCMPESGGNITIQLFDDTGHRLSIVALAKHIKEIKVTCGPTPANVVAVYVVTIEGEDILLTLKAA